MRVILHHIQVENRAVPGRKFANQLHELFPAEIPSTVIIMIIRVTHNFQDGIQPGKERILFMIPDVIQGSIHHDPSHPGFKTAGLLIPVTFDTADNLHKAIVQHIFGILTVSRISKAYCKQPWSMFIVQCTNGIPHGVLC